MLLPRAHCNWLCHSTAFSTEAVGKWYASSVRGQEALTPQFQHGTPLGMKIAVVGRSGNHEMNGTVVWSIDCRQTVSMLLSADAHRPSGKDERISYQYFQPGIF